MRLAASSFKWPVPQCPISLPPQPLQQCPHPARAKSQLYASLLLGDVPFSDLVQHLQSVPLSG